jgi:hypothetical protein
MFVRAALVVMLALGAAAVAQARVRTLDVKEPCPQAMMVSPAHVDAPHAPPRAGCACQGEADRCSCSGQSSESCCCAGRAEDPKPTRLSELPRRLLKRRAARRAP